jgi:hypothetical protein
LVEETVWKRTRTEGQQDNLQEKKQIEGKKPKKKAEKKFTKFQKRCVPYSNCIRLMWQSTTTEWIAKIGYHYWISYDDTTQPGVQECLAPLKIICTL